MESAPFCVIFNEKSQRKKGDYRELWNIIFVEMKMRLVI